MTENEKGLYAAFKAKDARFDGRIYVGISSTGIYCRPVCRAKRPKAENCTFYHTAAEAERAGYRPCLLCRPEIAPGASVADASAKLAYRAARLLEETCGGGLGMDELAGRLGCTDRHLRRVFMAEYNVSPVEYLQTCRLLLAKNLLTDTSLSVLDVAMASGFGSLRRFNGLFKKRYRLSPTSFRRHASNERPRGGDITLFLGYRPPYHWERMLGFLAGRAIAGVEAVRDGEYLRTVRLPDAENGYVAGALRVGHRPEKNALAVTLSESLLLVLPQALSRVRQLFDLNSDPAAIDETLGAMNELRPELYVPGTRLPGCIDAFEMSVRAVLGQQITVKAAGTLAARLTNAFGTPFETGIDGLTHAFPVPEDFSASDGSAENRLGELGVIGSRARTITALADEFLRGEIDFSLSAQPEEEIKKLMAIRGIGSWTAQYIAMRTMGWTDAFLETDAGVKKALPGLSSKRLLEMAEAWRPWRSYATVNLWNAL